MRDRRQWIAASGFVATVAYAMYMVVLLGAQEPKQPVTGDFSTAAVAEVRDSQGRVVLRGQFVPIDEADDDVERKAALSAAGPDVDAVGEAEVEVTTSTPLEQEIEFAIRNVEPGATYTFVIDDKAIGTARADQRGRAELEIDVERAR
jgi:hypothetical protein